MSECESRARASGETDVPAVRRAVAVLNLLATSDPLTAAEIQAATALTKTAIFRLLRVLREFDYVGQDEATHRYRLGLGALRLGLAAAAGTDLITAGQPLLDALRQQFDETINLGVLVDGAVLYVAMAESRQGLRMAAAIGKTDCPHATALGKAILASLPDDQQDDYIAMCPWPQRTPRTITSADGLRAELARTRERGFSIDEEENESGARCIGVPIFGADGAPIAGLSASGPASRIAGDRILEIAAGLWEASQELTRRLGGASSMSAGQAQIRRGGTRYAQPVSPVP